MPKKELFVKWAIDYHTKMEKTLQFLLRPSLLTIATFSTFEVNYHAP